MRERGIKFWNSLSDEEVQARINTTETRTLLAKSLGMHGGWMKVFNHRIDKGNFDLTHWREQKIERQKKKIKLTWSPEMRRHLGDMSRKAAVEKLQREVLPYLFVEDSQFDSAKARSIVQKWNWYFKWLPNECEKCGNTGEWQGQKLKLQVDHKNGDGRDHRLENLRFLCPNCHCQTETWGGGNSPLSRMRKGLDAVQTAPNRRTYSSDWFQDSGSPRRT